MRSFVAGLLILVAFLVPAAPAHGAEEAQPAVEPPEAEAAPAPLQEQEDPEKASRRWGFLEGRVGLAVSNDSNPSLLSEELSVSVPSANQTVKGTEGDVAVNLELRLAGHRLAGPQDHRRWNAGWTFDARQSSYQELDFLDLTDVRGEAHVAWGSAPLGYLPGLLGPARVPVGMSRVSVILQTGASQTLLDGDSYFRTFVAVTSIGLRETSTLATRLDLAALTQDFAEEPAVGRRSGEEIRVGLSQYIFLGREDRYLRFEAQRGERRAGRPFEGSFLRGGAELALPLGRGWTLSLAAIYQKDDFDHPESDLFAEFSPFDPEFEPENRSSEPRQDTVLRTLAALSYPIRGSLVATLRFSSVERDSNLGSTTTPDAYDYHRGISWIGLGWTFGGKRR